MNESENDFGGSSTTEDSYGNDYNTEQNDNDL